MSKAAPCLQVTTLIQIISKHCCANGHEKLREGEHERVKANLMREVVSIIMKKFNLVSVLALLNCVMLLYIAWIKYTDAGCAVCTQFYFLNINEVAIAILGFVGSLTLFLLGYYFQHNYMAQFVSLILSALIAGIATFLQVVQYVWSQSYCYYCGVAAIIFYLIFAIKLYQNICKPLFNRIIN